MRLPGDALVADPAVQTTEALYIDAQSSAVWHWLLQMDGPGRVHPQSEQLAVGDAVPQGWMGLPDALALSVAEIVSEKYIVLTTAGGDSRWNVVWSFHLQPHWEDRVRLLTRARIALRHPGEVFAMEMARPIVALGTRGLLLGIKHRVERLPSEQSLSGVKCVDRQRV